MKRKNKVPSAAEAKANTIKYMAQDIIDDISSCVREQLDNFEKEVLNILNENDELWTNNEKNEESVDKKKKR
jgi:hypothetical protein